MAIPILSAEGEQRKEVGPSTTDDLEGVMQGLATYRNKLGSRWVLGVDMTTDNEIGHECHVWHEAI